MLKCICVLCSKATTSFAPQLRLKSWWPLTVTFSISVSFCGNVQCHAWQIKLNVSLVNSTVSTYRFHLPQLSENLSQWAISEHRTCRHSSLCHSYKEVFQMKYTSMKSFELGIVDALSGYMCTYILFIAQNLPLPTPTNTETDVLMCHVMWPPWSQESCWYWD